MMKHLFSITELVTCQPFCLQFRIKLGLPKGKATIFSHSPPRLRDLVFAAGGLSKSLAGVGARAHLKAISGVDQAPFEMGTFGQKGRGEKLNCSF